MQTNILWSGREYYSLENCLVDSTPNGLIVNSTIIGYYNNKIYRVEYLVKTNELYETVYLDVKSLHDNKIQQLKLNGDGKGNWTSNGKISEQFTGCIDVDIPLTPFTNTLPIKRLALNKGQSQEIKVIYFDILEASIKAVNQKYTCLSKTSYHYENVPNDFEATIQVDDLGFVVDYPTLFSRKAALNTFYENI